MKIHQLLERNASRFPSKTFLYTSSRLVTYSEAWEIVKNASGGLHSLGIGAGDRVEFLAPDSIEYVLGMLATFKLGAIASLIDVADSDRFLDYTKTIEPKVILLSHELATRFEEDLESMKDLKFVSFEGRRNFTIAWKELLNSGNPDFEASFDEEAPCHLSFTSGTTYEPKPVVLSQEPTVRATRIISERFEISPDDITLTITPYSNSHVLVYGLLPQMHKQATTGFIEGPWNTSMGPKSCWDIVKRRHVTFLSGHTYRLRPVADYALAHRREKFRLRKVVSGGGPSYLSLRKKWQKLRITFMETYGMSECGGALAATPPQTVKLGKAVARPGVPTCGPVLPDKEVRIVNEHDTELPPGEVGEITFRGGYMWGYWRMPDETAEKTRSGWLHTGDVGYIDEYDNLYWLARKTDLIHSGEKILYPRITEEALYLNDGVAQASVVSVGDKSSSGEVPWAFVVPYPKTRLSEENLLRFCKMKLPTHYVPRRIIIRKSLPLTASGKIEKKALKNLM